MCRAVKAGRSALCLGEYNQYAIACGLIDKPCFQYRAVIVSQRRLTRYFHYPECDGITALIHHEFRKNRFIASPYSSSKDGSQNIFHSFSPEKKKYSVQNSIVAKWRDLFRVMSFAHINYFARFSMVLISG